MATINTTKGLFEYVRLPYCVSSAPGIYQRIMEQLLQNIPMKVMYLDDILVSGSTPEEHDRNLRTVLTRLLNKGLRLRKGKCVFRQKSCRYLGHVIDEEGMCMFRPRSLVNSRVHVGTAVGGAVDAGRMVGTAVGGAVDAGRTVGTAVGGAVDAGRTVGTVVGGAVDAGRTVGTAVGGAVDAGRMVCTAARSTQEERSVRLSAARSTQEEPSVRLSAARSTQEEPSLCIS